MCAQEHGHAKADWKEGRARTLTAIESLRRQGLCYVCRDLETHEVFGEQPVIYEDAVYRLVLDSFPVNPGQAILTYKPHREGLSSLSGQEAGRVFKAVVYAAKAIKGVLRAEKVYLFSMPDGPSSHLVFQLLPRFAGQPMGLRLLRQERRPLKDGAQMVRKIAAVMAPASEPVEQG